MLRELVSSLQEPTGLFVSHQMVGFRCFHIHPWILGVLEVPAPNPNLSSREFPASATAASCQTPVPESLTFHSHVLIPQQC